MEERDLDEGRILILPFVGGLLSGWGVGMYDFDNDGHKDLFTANSHVSENAGARDPRNPYHSTTRCSTTNRRADSGTCPPHPASMLCLPPLIAAPRSAT